MLRATTVVITLFFSLPSDLSADTQLRFVTWRPDPPWVWDQAITNFESQNPGIKVSREVGPHSSTEFHDLVTQKLKNGDLVMDVFFMDVIWRRGVRFGAARPFTSARKRSACIYLSATSEFRSCR